MIPAEPTGLALETPHLTLVPWPPALLVALMDRPETFEAGCGMPAATGLRELFVSGDESPGWVAALRASSGPDPWRHGFLVVHRAEAVVVGTAAFKGPPDEAGVTEIAYGIAPGYRGRGCASEAAAALVAYARADGRAGAIIAHTAPEVNASTRVLSKCGFRCLGPVNDPDDGLLWRWEHVRV